MIIPFNKSDRENYYKRLDDVFNSNFLSEGRQVREFEDQFNSLTGLQSKAVCNGGSGLLALYEFIGVKDREVIVPANTFWATAAAAKRAGARVVYADCNTSDLCLSAKDLAKRITPSTKAVAVVHIGGHIAFDIEEIAALCREKNIALIEDCCHAHGATYKGLSAGSWGIGGVYSFYATKTMPIGEGGMVVSKNPELLEWLGYYRNYGKEVIDGKVNYRFDNGFNFRMSEVAAALGNVQMERLPSILEWKRELASKFDRIFERRLKLPEQMSSGYYKYIVFDTRLKEQTGQVFGRNDLGYNIDSSYSQFTLPNSEWVAEHHACVPIWHGWPHAEYNTDRLKEILL